MRAAPRVAAGAVMVAVGLAGSVTRPQAAVAPDAPRLASPEPGASRASRDWGALRAENPDTAAWLRVAGTSVDTPVVRQPQGEAEGWYLAHGFGGESSEAGCPYLDANCDADGPLRIAFGHHLAFTSLAFSELRGSEDPRRFQGLGTLVWETPQRSESLEPLCALRVDREDARLRLARSEGVDDLGAWLLELCERAGAHAGDWRDRCARARSAVVLVTCASLVPGGPDRTVVAFAR